MGLVRASPPVSYSYSVLSRPATTADNVAAWRVTPQMMAEAQPAIGIDAAGTRLLRRSRGATLVAFPTRTGGACLAQAVATGDEGLACSTPEDPTTALIGYGKAVGLVPDGVSQVMFHLTSGEDVVGAVIGNLYDAPAEAQSVTFSVGGRVEHVELMPAGSLPPEAVMHPDGTVSLGRQP